jgi:type VI secretion system protein ImpG
MADISFIHYYQTELAYYRELAQEFAHVHPEVAHLVTERGGDPAAERLFQGAALLTSRLRHRVDDDFPEIIHPLFDELWPQFLRPVPALTLLRFSPAPNALRQSQTIPAGALVAGSIDAVGSEPIECPFSTSAPVELHPLEIEDAALIRPHPADLQLQVRLRLTGGALYDNVQLRSLRLQLLGETATKYTLYEWLSARAERVSLLTPDGATCLQLPRDVVRPVGLSPEEAICPCSATPLPDLHLLQEYFLFPDKFLGIEIRGLEAAPPRLLTERFEVRIHLGNVPDSGLRIDAGHLALGCVVATNISQTTDIEIPVKRDASRFRLPAPAGGQVFSVSNVRAFDTHVGEWVDYPRFLDQRLHTSGEQLPRYLIQRREDGVEGVQTYLQITDRDGRPMTPSAEMLQVSQTTTNGPLPLRLGLGDVTRPLASPEYAVFTNVTPVLPGAPLVLGRERFWELLALYTMHPRDLCSRNGIELLLREAEGARVDSRAPEILEVRTAISNRLHRRTMVPVRQVEISVSDDSFACEGQMYLFAVVLSRLFAPQRGTLVFNEVAVRGVPSGVTYRFAPG